MKTGLNVLSYLWGVPNHTLREAMMEANLNSICFNINVTDMDQAIDVNLHLDSSGFEIVQGNERCSDIQNENSIDTH